MVRSPRQQKTERNEHWSETTLNISIMASEHVVVDALPYYDKGYDEPGVKEAVNSTIFRYIIFLGSLSRICVRN